MFDDFRPETMSREQRARMGGSMAAAALVYSGLAALVLCGTAAGHAVVENLTQVEFVSRPPEPPPPPPPPPAPAVAPPQVNARPKAKRRDLKPPDEVPKEKPKESNEALTSEESGPVDGFLNGVEGGTGTAVAVKAAPPPPPPPKPQPLIQPVASSNNAQPPYSMSARRKEIEGAVEFTFDVLENGTVANVKIVSGPVELHETVLKTVATWRFTPAKRGGKPERTSLRRRIKFQLTDE